MHRRQHFVRHRGRPRDHQELAAGGDGHRDALSVR
jgi:hypothetical protein